MYISHEMMPTIHVYSDKATDVHANTEYKELRQCFNIIKCPFKTYPSKYVSLFGVIKQGIFQEGLTCCFF